MSGRSRTADSGGSDIKIRGNASQLLDKYQALARDANTAGDRVAAENYYQHAEHYYRLIHADDKPREAPAPNAGKAEANGATTPAENGGEMPDPESGQGGEQPPV